MDFPENIYRLLAVRYLFLILLGWIWIKDGLKINRFTIALSILSLFAIIYFEYLSVDDEPFFFNTKWKYHRWPCYYFVANGFIWFLYYIWNYFKKWKILTICIKYLASASYEIFLFQMTLIFLFKHKDLSFLPNTFLQYSVWFILIWSLSLTGGIILHKLIEGRERIAVK